MNRLPILLLALVLFSCAEYRQNGDAMAPTINDGDLVDMEETPYKNAKPARWDIVVYESPTGEGDWIGRVVGLPGETIDIADGKVLVNGVAQTAPDTALRYMKEPRAKAAMPYVVPKDSYFLLGDNTSEALDGREFGATPRAKIKGKVTGLNTNSIQKKILEESEQ
jgi:signal peptidase I